ncbi:MAG: hypothetical protein JSV45_06220 [Chromatiales bacterium]|nr:MAG: hypothetical protein JSV45_06220 [Chromatiales bacterium]
MTYKTKILPLLIVGLLPLAASGDAIIRTQAMFASTIAELYVEKTSVRLELEIGLADLGAFRSLLPDDIHQKLGFDAEPMAARIARFLDSEFVIFAGGNALDGELLRIGPADRVRRDEITGEPLPPGEEPEIVINATFLWMLDEPPAQIEFGLALPAAASVGFVVYHEGIAVNDFRYMTASQVLKLDWGDPWYSAFETRALRRQYYAPMTGFIYVEPYEVRKEIIVRPKDIQRYVDLGLEGRNTIPVEMQADVRQKIIDFLSQHHPVTIDGKPAEPAMVRADFLERTLRTSRVIDPPEELDVNAAIMGVKFIYPHESFPDKATMRWDLWDERTQMVPVSAVDPTGPLPQFLEPDYDLLEWQNFIRIPVMPQLAEVTSPPSAVAQFLYYGRWGLLLISALLMLWFVRSAMAPTNQLAGIGILTGVGIAVTMGGWWLGAQVRLKDDATRSVITGVLTNVYRAFDFRAESDVYDVLERSVDGELLRDVYLEMRRGLVLASQGGASARVKDVELVELEAEPAEDQGIQARATWQVRAAVGHWGHIHERRNEYQADLTLQPIDGAWKLVDVEILDEVRL